MINGKGREYLTVMQKKNKVIRNPKIKTKTALRFRDNNNAHVILQR